MNNLAASHLIQFTKKELELLPADWSLVPVMGKQPSGGSNAFKTGTGQTAFDDRVYFW
ncbi:hypothetical protein [Chlorogloea sp. CCALA 695]|uniref:hypothetical protein n=1 Tax=Chlorogloea sp. CCALA 695 TaxID=2107693 RepID=UPI001304CCBC|nr:hypothetical protein [Chlorogloea sp. CCALA 695]